MPPVDGLDEFLTPNNMVNANDEPEEDPTEDDSATDPLSMLKPVAVSAMNRMENNWKKAIPRIRGDYGKIAEHYGKYEDFVRRAMGPVVESAELGLNCTPSELTDRFVSRHMAELKAVDADKLEGVHAVDARTFDLLQ